MVRVTAIYYQSRDLRSIRSHFFTKICKKVNTHLKYLRFEWSPKYLGLEGLNYVRLRKIETESPLQNIQINELTNDSAYSVFDFATIRFWVFCL